MILGCPILLSFQAAGGEVVQINEVEVLGVVGVLEPFQNCY